MIIMMKLEISKGNWVDKGVMVMNVISWMKELIILRISMSHNLKNIAEIGEIWIKICVNLLYEYFGR